MKVNPELRDKFLAGAATIATIGTIAAATFFDRPPQEKSGPTVYYPGDTITTPYFEARVAVSGIQIDYDQLAKTQKIFAHRLRRQSLSVNLMPVAPREQGVTMDINATGIGGGAVNGFGDIFLPTDPTAEEVMLTVARVRHVWTGHRFLDKAVSKLVYHIEPHRPS